LHIGDNFDFGIFCSEIFKQSLPFFFTVFKNINSIKHYSNSHYLLTFLKLNPFWLSGFTNGEGCFTASLILDKRSMWGLLPQCEFNITQSMHDLILLEPINLFFNNSGGVYPRQNNVGTVSFRKISVLKDTIIPFFIKYPFIGRKSKEFERWIELVNLLYLKKHLGDTLDSRHSFIQFSHILIDLNPSLINPTKLIRLKIIIDWLNSLESRPTSDQKLNLINLLKSKNSDDII